MAVSVFIYIVTAARTSAAEFDLAIPLPPPPELLDDYPHDPDSPPPEIRPAGRSVEETRQALEPPQTVTAQSAPQPMFTVTTPSHQPAPTPAPYTAPVPAAVVPEYRSPMATMTISPPSKFMPADYFNLPVDDEGVPGVILPELDDGFVDPGFRPPVARPTTPGMTIRQLEPYFALAKGSEGMAIEARKRGEEHVYADQIVKAVDAYMAIIAMADAGNEAREEAWYGVARCEYRRGNWWRAFEALERSFPEHYDKSEVEGRVKLETYIGERMWRMGAEPVPEAAANGRALNGYQAASEVYGKIVVNLPDSEDAPLALLRRGDAAAMAEEWKDASRYYRQVVEYFPDSEPAMQARSSLTEAIYRQEWPRGFPEGARDDVGSIMDDVERANANLSPEAQERRQRAVSLANDLEAGTKLRQAKEYLKSLRVRKSRDAAVFLLGDVVSRYPETAQAGEAADILRGMGIEPPMVLSDGRRFPITAGASGADYGDETAMPGFGGGLVGLEGQDDIWNGVLPPSPTRETVYEPFSPPGIP